MRSLKNRSHSAKETLMFLQVESNWRVESIGESPVHRRSSKPLFRRSARILLIAISTLRFVPGCE
jgi:hypothetical protein